MLLLSNCGQHPVFFLHGATPLASHGVAFFHVGPDPLYVLYVRHSGQHSFIWSFLCCCFEDMVQTTFENNDAKRMPAGNEVARPIFFKVLLFSKSWSNGVENCDVSCNPDVPTRDSASAEVCVYYSA